MFKKHRGGPDYGGLLGNVGKEDTIQIKQNGAVLYSLWVKCLFSCLSFFFLTCLEQMHRSKISQKISQKHNCSHMSFSMGWRGKEARFKGWVVHNGSKHRGEFSKRMALGAQSFWMGPLESGKPGEDFYEPCCHFDQGSVSFGKQAICFWKTNNSRRISMVNVLLCMLCSWSQRVRGIYGQRDKFWIGTKILELNQFLLNKLHSISIIIASACLMQGSS